MSKKPKKIEKLLRFIEMEKYNIKELAKKIYGNDNWYSQTQINCFLSNLRKKGIPAYPQGQNGIVKIPSDIEEWRMTNQRDFNRKRGNLMMHMRLIRTTLLEEPELRRELLPQIDKLIIIASMGQTKKLYGNTTNTNKLTDSRQKSAKTRN